MRVGRKGVVDAPLTNGSEALDVGALIDTATAEDAPAEDAADGDPAEQGCGESFTASTKILLASGAAIPISQLKTGMKVLATNTKTGKTQPETITAVLVHHDTDLYDLTVRTGHPTAVIHTTRNHLFWDVTQGTWVKAAALNHGDHLRAATGQASVTVAGGSTPAVVTGWMWDLTVPGNNDHDFYIDTGTSAVLVHNEDNCPTNLGRGSTGRVDPADLNEQLAMEEAQSNPTVGRVLTQIAMNDSRWPAADGWLKMQQNINGVIIHYLYNPEMNAVDDFKFAG